MSHQYQKEIEEILKKAGEAPPEQPSHGPDEPPPPRRRRPARGSIIRRAGIGYKHTLLAGIIVLIISAFYGGLILFLVGLGLLVAGYVMYYRAPRSGGGGGRSVKMWRGRPVEPGDDPHFTQDRWGRRR